MSLAAAVAPLTLQTRLRHSPLAVCHVMGNANEIDFAYLGGHHYLHRGAGRTAARRKNGRYFYGTQPRQVWRSRR